MTISRSIDTGTRDQRSRDEPGMDPPPVIGGSERRMHVRAYNFWVSLLGGRAFPVLEAFDPAAVSDFGDHGVLFDFGISSGDPAVRFLGEALRAEAAASGGIVRVSDLPRDTLVPRLIDSYPQIIANRAPVGFEAEFVNVRGNYTLYRGILLPFSADGTQIDHVYAVVNWKEMADSADALLLARQVRAAIGDQAARAAAGGRSPSTPWADGPSSRLLAPDDAGGDGDAAPAPITPLPWSPVAMDDPATASGRGGVLADQLSAARGTIEQLRSAELRARSALYRGLGVAYDFSCTACAEPDDLAVLLGAPPRRRRRASMLEIVQLIFGADHDRKRLAEFAIVLAHGHRLKLPSGGLRRLLEGSEGGVKAIVAAERAARRTAAHARASAPGAAPPRRRKAGGGSGSA